MGRSLPTSPSWGWRGRVTGSLESWASEPSQGLPWNAQTGPFLWEALDLLMPS